MTRRHVKEYRPDEALILISADRDRRPLRCPACGSEAVGRSPARGKDESPTQGRVVITCGACGRSATYLNAER